MSQNRTKMIWLLMLLLLAATMALVSCSGGERLLLAEYNRDAEAEIFLAELGADASEWQSLAKDVRRTFIFEGEFATFVPDSKRILLWYEDGNDVRIEQIEIGDESPTELLEGNVGDRLFARYETDPFTVYVTESQDFSSYRCYVAQDGAKAERLARGTVCFMNENGVLQLDVDRNDALTLTLISLDGEDQTVVLDEIEDVGTRVRNNEAMSQIAYVVGDRDEAQLFLIAPGDEAGEPFGEAFASIELFGFLGDDKMVYVVSRVKEDDDEVGLFINGTGDALIEADEIRLMGQSEDGEFAIFAAESRGETAVFHYNLDDNTATELLEEESVNLLGFVMDEHFLLKTVKNDEETLYSVSQDGSEMVELLATDDYEILTVYFNQAAEQLLVQLQHKDDNYAYFVTGLTEEDGYFLVEDWYSLTALNASDDQFVFWGREDQDDDVALYSVAWAEDASEVVLDDRADFGFYSAFFAKDGRTLYYTAIDDGFGDFEVRTVPVDGSESADRLYRDMVLLDVSWEEEANFQRVR